MTTWHFLKLLKDRRMQTKIKRVIFTLQMTEDIRMQLVDLFSIGFVNKLMSANVSSLRFSNFKVFDLLKSCSY